ncbi:MAG: hypothetical protein K2W96_10240, partial [Gemmataceae bacterium]|nr:hypothetical protein [Gemmataceae bacterium]
MGATAALGLRVIVARDPARLLDTVRKEAPACVLLDLHEAGLDVPKLLAELREACPAMPRVIAFGSHVDAERLRAARAAGCDLVLP